MRVLQLFIQQYRFYGGYGEWFMLFIQQYRFYGGYGEWFIYNHRFVKKSLQDAKLCSIIRKSVIL